jgi:DNA invertase Pin-like site-specific DNA recombinase
MHKAACNGRDFDVIIVWDQDRFGRFNSIEAGYWIHPLMKAGVKLVTVTEGVINWSDFTGRVVNAIKQEGKHQFLVDLSRNVARGQVTKARNGFLCGQAAPYGYDRMLVDDAGNRRQRVHNGETFAKPRAWNVTLVPSDDPEKVAAVREMFRRYAETDIGIRSLVNDLNERGVPAPRNRKWYVGTVREILRNEAYIGTFTWAKRRMGKYHRVAAGEIRTREDGEQVKVNPCEEWIVKREAHEPLVDAATFRRVQEKLASRRDRKARAKDRDRYLLSGMVFCAHCGQKMHGMAGSKRKNGKLYVWPKYVCSTYTMKGKHCCGYHAVDQAKLLGVIVDAIRTAVFCGNRDELRQRVLDRLEARQKADPQHVQQLRGKVAEIDRELEQGTRRLLRAPDNIADLLAAELSTLRSHRDRLAGELDEIERTDCDADLDAQADQIVASLWTMHAGLEDGDPSRRRELLRRVIDRIDLHFDSVQK